MAPIFVAICLLAVAATSGVQSASPIATSPLLDTAGDGLFAVEPLIALANMARPVDSFRSQTENRERELTDHSNDEIYNSTTQQILARSGFESRTYQVISSDGYITEIIQVINPEADPSELKQPPVMIFHGGLIDPSAYLWGSAIEHHPEKYPRTAEDGPITSSNRSLGFMLANYGYDVWLIGTRGANRQNLKHTTLKVKYLEDILADPLDAEAPQEIVDTLKYFDYSQDELVEYEFPAQIEKVLQLTNSSKVSTITYSLSTHVMYKILAANKTLAEKIYTNVALAPLLNRKGANTFWKTLEDISVNTPEPVGNLLFTQVLLTQGLRDLLRQLPRYSIVYYITTILLGASPRYQTWLEDPVLGHTFLPLSFTELKHYCQQVMPDEGILQKYDHGPAENMELYGQLTPPVYNISDIQIKRWMMVSGDTDVLGTLDSGDTYARLIPNPPTKFLRMLDGWNHYDHTASFNVDTKVNLPILDFFDQYSSTNATEIALAES